jgi:hypothetical protein
MEASKEFPLYSVYIVTDSGKLDLTPVLISLSFNDQKKQMAQSLTAQFVNILFNGVWLSTTLQVRQRIFVYADDGETNDEVFRGYVWSRTYQSGVGDREITLKCYDNLIYIQESEVSEYFSAGKSTQDVITELLGNWGVSVDYQFDSITHAKLALRGSLGDIITNDLLNLVVDRNAKKYMITSSKDTIKIAEYGSNSKIYNIKFQENAIQTRSISTMDDMVTQVVITGKADEEGREPVEATVSGNTGQYGTIQQVISRDENTSLADAKAEAQGILDENGEPKWEYEIRVADIPWLRKGDKVFVAAGDIDNRELIVTGVSRSISAKAATMTLDLERP